MVKTITWSLISSYHDNVGIPASGLIKANTPWSGHFEVQPALWAMAHFTQFAEPGWIYLEGGANGYLKNGGSYTSFISPDKQDVSIIIETIEALDNESVTFNLIGSYTNKEFYLWKTDSVNHFIKQPNVIKPSDGSLTLTVEKGAIYTLTTTTGQQKGYENLNIPKATEFHLPYYDNFEYYEVDKLPRYTSDISGVFEVANDKKNKVLK